MMDPIDNPKKKEISLTMAHLILLAWMMFAHITEGAVYINVFVCLCVCVFLSFSAVDGTRVNIRHFLQAKL